MSKWLLIEEYHVSFELSKTSPDSAKIRRTLASRSFMSRLRKTIREAAERYPSLRSTRVILSR